MRTIIIQNNNLLKFAIVVNRNSLKNYSMRLKIGVSKLLRKEEENRIVHPKEQNHRF